MPSSPPYHHSGRSAVGKERLLAYLLCLLSSAPASVALTAALIFMMYVPSIFIPWLALLEVLWFTVLLKVSFRVAQRSRNATQTVFTGQMAVWIGIGIGLVVGVPISIIAIFFVPVPAGSAIGLVWIPVLILLVAIGLLLGVIGTLIGTFLGWPTEAYKRRFLGYLLCLLSSVPASFALTVAFIFISYAPSLFWPWIALLAIIWFTIVLKVSFRSAQRSRGAIQAVFAGQTIVWIGIGIGLVVGAPISFIAMFFFPVQAGSDIAFVWVVGMLPFLGVLGVFLGAIGGLIGNFRGRAASR